MQWIRLTTVFVFASSSFAIADHWPQFRGPQGSGRSAETNLPERWSDTEGLVWKTPLPGYGASSPIVWGDKIFLTAYSGYGLGEDSTGAREALECQMVCIKRADGEVAWKKSIPAAADEQDYDGFVKLHGFASATPVADETTVYGVFGVTGLIAMTHDGEFKWQADLGSETHNFGSGASPILHAGLLIVNAATESSSLIAFDKTTGEEKWRRESTKQIWATPLLVKTASGQELILSMKDQCVALDPLTGKELWICEATPDYVCPSPVVHEEVIYGIGGRKGFAFAVKAGGRGEVTASHRQWTQSVGSNVPSPVFHDGKLYWVDHKGQAICLDAKSGEILSRERITGKTYSSITYGDGKLYVTSREEGTFVLEATPALKQIAHNVIESDSSVFNASLAIHNGQLLLRSDTFLYCIGK